MDRPSQSRCVFWQSMAFKARPHPTTWHHRGRLGMRESHAAAHLPASTPSPVVVPATDTPLTSYHATMSAPPPSLSGHSTVHLFQGSFDPIAFVYAQRHVRSRLSMYLQLFADTAQPRITDHIFLFGLFLSLRSRSRSRLIVIATSVSYT